MPSLRHSLNLKNGGVISLVGAGGKTSLMFRLAHELSRQGAPVLTTTTTKIYTPSCRQSPVVMIPRSAETLASEAFGILKHNRHISSGRRRIPFQNKLKGFRPVEIDAIWRSGAFRWIIVEADGAAGKPLKAPAGHEPVIPPCTKWVIGVVGLEAVGKPLTERWVFRPGLVSKITGLAQGASISESTIADALSHVNGIIKGFPAQAKRFVFLNQAESEERLTAGKRIAKIIKSQHTVGFTGVLIGQTLYEPFVKNYYPAN
jgi:probable selenium-dependent hydroxylase accessory protein YqeC